MEKKLNTVPEISPAVAGVVGVKPNRWSFTRKNLDQLKGDSVRGGLVTVVSEAFRFVLQTGSMIVIARLLTPDEFGVQGMVLALTGFVLLFKDAGLSMATVQRDEISHEEVSTLFWINTAIGVLLSLIIAAAAPILVMFYHEPRLFWVTIGSGLAFLISGLGTQHGALLQRAMRYTAMARISVYSLLVSSVVGIGMALAGCGYWSLVGMTLASTIVGTVGSFIALPWIPGMPRRGQGIRSMLHFGGTITLNNLIVYLAYNTVPNMLLGRFCGAEAVGLFGRAYQLVNLPMQQLNNAIYKVAFPALSRIQNDNARVCRSFLSGYSVLLSFNTPITISTALFAEEIIRILLGEKWLHATPVLLLLTPAILGFALVNPLGWFMMATGRALRSLRIAYLVGPVVILGVAAGLPHGLNGVALGFSVAVVVLVVPIVIWALHGTGITMRDFWATVKQPMLSGMVAGVCGLGIKFALGSALGPIPALLVGSCGVFGIYAFVLLVIMGQKARYVDLVKQVIERKRAKQAQS